MSWHDVASFLFPVHLKYAFFSSSIIVFSCGHATLKEALPVRPSVRPSVRWSVMIESKSVKTRISALPTRPQLVAVYPALFVLQSELISGVFRDKSTHFKGCLRILRFFIKCLEMPEHFF